VRVRVFGFGTFTLYDLLHYSSHDRWHASRFQVHVIGVQVYVKVCSLDPEKGPSYVGYVYSSA
jgi:hypothetical protein